MELRRKYEETCLEFAPTIMGAARISLLAGCIIPCDARDIAYSGHVFDALDAYMYTCRGIPNLLEERRDRLEKSSMRYATGESRENANGIHLLKRDEMAFQVSRAIRIPRASHPRDNHSRQIKKCS